MDAIRILHLEDDPLDAELINESLRSSNAACIIVCVDRRADFVRELKHGDYQLLLCDYSVPQFDGLSALKLARELRPEVPLIFVSGAIGEHTATETLKEGATDYVIKDRLDRLVPAVDRALREAAEQAQRRQAEASLRASEDRYRVLVDQLVEADQRKDEFLAMLAHELRNPLAPILSAVELINRKAANDDSLSEPSAIVSRQVQHMTRLLDDLLDVSRVSRGKIVLRKTTIEISKLVDCAVESSKPLIESRGHEFTVSLPEEPIFVRGDADRLEQVLVNLLNNAAKYTKGRGHISLCVGVDSDEVVIRVNDDGLGISADMLTTVFELFAQSDRSLARSSGGLGLGLALVRRLVEMHNGHVDAHSEGAGRGSEFTVRLPMHRLAESKPRPLAHAAATNPTAIASSPLSPAASTDCGQRILLVDDNADALYMLEMLLRMEGLEIDTAIDGQQAIDAASQSKPDVVVLDIGLPDIDGYEVAMQLRAKPEHRDTILIAVTGYGQASDRERSRLAGFDHHLVKPVDLDMLMPLLSTRG